MFTFFLTDIWENLYILLLMTHFHNAPSNFVNLALGETGTDYRNAQLGSE